MQITISKSYSESIVIDYQTWKYSTTISKVVDVESSEDLSRENDKLFKQVKKLTEKDIEKERSERVSRLEKLRNNEDI